MKGGGGGGREEGTGGGSRRLPTQAQGRDKTIDKNYM